MELIKNLLIASVTLAMLYFDLIGVFIVADLF